MINYKLTFVVDIVDGLMDSSIIITKNYSCNIEYELRKELTTIATYGLAHKMNENMDNEYLLYIPPHRIKMIEAQEIKS